MAGASTTGRSVWGRSERISALPKRATYSIGAPAQASAAGHDAQRSPSLKALEVHPQIIVLDFGSGGPFTLKVDEAPRTLPPGVTSAAGDTSSLFTRYLDAAGVQRIDPAIR